MKIITKQSITSKLTDHIREYGGPTNIDSVVLTSDEYHVLCTELGLTEVTEFKGINIVLEEELLHG